PSLAGAWVVVLAWLARAGVGDLVAARVGAAAAPGVGAVGSKPARGWAPGQTSVEHWADRRIRHRRSRAEAPRRVAALIGKPRCWMTKERPPARLGEELEEAKEFPRWSPGSGQGSAPTERWQPALGWI